MSGLNNKLLIKVGILLKLSFKNGVFGSSGNCSIIKINVKVLRIVIFIKIFIE